MHRALALAASAVVGLGACGRLGYDPSGSSIAPDYCAELPALGLTPPPSNRTASVRADLIVGQDGLPRAVRLVN